MNKLKRIPVYSKNWSGRGISMLNYVETATYRIESKRPSKPNFLLLSNEKKLKLLCFKYPDESLYKSLLDKVDFLKPRHITIINKAFETLIKRCN